MSETPKKIEFTIINDSAAELEIASKVTFSVSELMIPFFFTMSTAGLM